MATHPSDDALLYYIASVSKTMDQWFQVRLLTRCTFSYLMHSITRVAEVLVVDLNSQILFNVNKDSSGNMTCI